MRTVTVKTGQMGRFDDGSPFLVEEGALALKFALPQAIGEYMLAVRNVFAGGATERTIPVPKTGEVTLEGLLAGELNMTVYHYLHGERIARHNIEPLLIKEADKNVYAYPEIAALDARMTEVENTLIRLFDERSGILPELAKKTGGIETLSHRILVAFAAFSWAVYRSSFTLNSKGLSADEFLSVIGVDVDRLSDEDREAIGALKEEL